MQGMGDSAAAGMTEPKRSGLAWGIFLGVSWTWCIGMFLPVLLLRDLGPGAFVVFAVPNVIGLYLLAPVVRREMNSYFARVRSGDIRSTRVAPAQPVGSA